MTRVAVIADTHIGVKNDSPIFLEQSNKFFQEQFFPIIKERDIKKVYHLGDLVDRRKYINIKTLHSMRTNILDPLKEMNIDTHIIVGNHDIFHKNVITPNALDELLRHYDFNIYTKPVTNSDGISMIPWICSENEEQCMDEIEFTNARICFGHFQLNGFEMHKGSFAETGLDNKLFEKFSLVLSGHFHTRSTYNNISYIGCPYEMSWADYMDPKGFNILNLDTLEMEFIQNKKTMFHKIVYDDTKETLDDMKNRDFSRVSGGYVKVIIKEKDNPYWFDIFADRLEQANPFNIQYIEDHRDVFMDDTNLSGDDVQDTKAIISEYVKRYSGELTSDYLRNGLDSTLKELYNEAILNKVY